MNINDNVNIENEIGIISVSETPSLIPSQRKKAASLPLKEGMSSRSSQPTNDHQSILLLFILI